MTPEMQARLAELQNLQVGGTLSDTQTAELTDLLNQQNIANGIVTEAPVDQPVPNQANQADATETPVTQDQTPTDSVEPVNPSNPGPDATIVEPITPEPNLLDMTPIVPSQPGQPTQSDQSMEQVVTTSHGFIGQILADLERLRESGASNRELSMTITKLEEGIMWLGQAAKKLGVLLENKL